MRWLCGAPALWKHLRERRPPPPPPPPPLWCRAVRLAATDGKQQLAATRDKHTAQLIHFPGCLLRAALNYTCVPCCCIVLLWCVRRCGLLGFVRRMSGRTSLWWGLFKGLSLSEWRRDSEHGCQSKCADAAKNVETLHLTDFTDRRWVRLFCFFFWLLQSVKRKKPCGRIQTDDLLFDLQDAFRLNRPAEVVAAWQKCWLTKDFSLSRSTETARRWSRCRSWSTKPCQW